MQLGGSIASTVLVTILDRRTSFHSDIFRGSATLHVPEVTALAGVPGGLLRVARAIEGQAVNSGFADTLFTLALAALAAIVPIAFLRLGARPTGPVIAAE